MSSKVLLWLQQLLFHSPLLWQEPIFYVRLAWTAAEKNWLLFRFGDDEQKCSPGRHFPDTLCGKKKKKELKASSDSAINPLIQGSETS